EEKELLKKGRGAEIFSGSNFGAQNHTTCGQSVDTSSCNTNGITLIALIITIVIMLILAGITINLTLGENGIFQKAKLARSQYETASVQEKLEMDVMAFDMGKTLDLTMEQYLENLRTSGISEDSMVDRIDTTDVKEKIIKIGDRVYSIYSSSVNGNKVRISFDKGENVMMHDLNNWNDANDTWLNTGIARKDIKSISFVNEIPDFDEEPNTDVTALGHGEGKVMAWWSGDSENGYNICIGANGGVIAPKSCTSLFANMEQLTTVDFGESAINFDTSNTIDMTKMFRMGAISNLSNISFEGFNTSNVYLMQRWIENNLKITSVNLTSFNTSKVENMDRMFATTGLTTLDVSNFDTSSVTDMQCMFMITTLSGSLDLSSFNTSKVINMGEMFRYCRKLERLILGDNFDTSSVTNMKNMFSEIWLIDELDLGEKFDTSKVINMGGMFYELRALKNLDLGDKFDTGKVTNMDYI
ncbi:MAG: BspA family leucine-rich repeat surface protein, partial [Clostridia bacterium]|nr:BspA family leucine-rich repeat surface protein [Clostridia bacterium]